MTDVLTTIFFFDVFSDLILNSRMEFVVYVTGQI